MASRYCHTWKEWLEITLDKPEKIIKIDGLPENLGPITRDSKNTEYTFSSDLKEYIHRNQVWVLLNFSIHHKRRSDQEKPSWFEQLQKSSILLYLSVKKFNCKWNYHHAVIFPQLIICRASEITKLRYEGKLPDHIQGSFRNPWIRPYQKWKGTGYVPPLTHPALKWSVTDPLPLLPIVTDALGKLLTWKWNYRWGQNNIYSAWFSCRKRQCTSQIRKKGKIWRSWKYEWK